VQILAKPEPARALPDFKDYCPRPRAPVNRPRDPKKTRPMAFSTRYYSNLLHLSSMQTNLHLDDAVIMGIKNQCRRDIADMMKNSSLL